jgi:nitrogen fixation/metabolism regulation signal transduction histidine kinase
VRNAVEAVERLTEDADERKQRRTVFVTMTGGNRSDDLCQIIIEDQGVGMSREILRVF